jgi:hypothetical protein
MDALDPHQQIEMMRRNPLYDGSLERVPITVIAGMGLQRVVPMDALDLEMMPGSTPAPHRAGADRSGCSGGGSSRKASTSRGRTRQNRPMRQALSRPDLTQSAMVSLLMPR